MRDSGAIHWIASYPKSGNTLVRLMLRGLLDGAPAPLSALRHPQMSSMQSLYISDRAAKSKIRARRRVIKDILRIQSDICRKTDMFIKTHAAAVRVDDLKYFDWGKTGSFIYIIRDPREIVQSLSHHMKIDDASSVSYMCDRGAMIEIDDFVEPLLSWSDHVKSWMSAPKQFKRLVLRFEDIVRQKRNAVRALNAFYRFQRSEAVVAAIADSLSFEALQAQEAAGGFEEAISGVRFFRRGAAESWRAGDVAILKPLTDAHGDVMKTFGYV